MAKVEMRVPLGGWDKDERWSNNVLPMLGLQCVGLEYDDGRPYREGEDLPVVSGEAYLEWSSAGEGDPPENLRARLACQGRRNLSAWLPLFGAIIAAVGGLSVAMVNCHGNQPKAQLGQLQRDMASIGAVARSLRCEDKGDPRVTISDCLRRFAAERSRVSGLRHRNKDLEVRVQLMRDECRPPARGGR